MEMILVSVVITTFQRKQDVVIKAVKSVLAQTYSNFELILVDDNRGENSYTEQIRSITNVDDRIVYTRTHLTHGAQAARNKGIQESKGKYVAFLDDDDDWLPQKLEKQVALMEKESNAGMCFCRGYRVNNCFQPPVVDEIHQGNFYTEVFYDQLLRGDCIGSTSQALIRRDVFESCGNFDESLPARQDYEMWIRISRNFRLVGVDECLFRHHLYPGEQISKQWKKCVEGHTRLYEKYKEDIDRDHKAKFNVIFYLAHYHAVGHQWRKSIQLYIKSFFVSPICFWEKGVIKLRDMYHLIGDKNK